MEVNITETLDKLRQCFNNAKKMIWIKDGGIQFRIVKYLLKDVDSNIDVRYMLNFLIDQGMSAEDEFNIREFFEKKGFSYNIDSNLQTFQITKSNKKRCRDVGNKNLCYTIVDHDCIWFDSLKCFEDNHDWLIKRKKEILNEKNSYKNIYYKSKYKFYEITDYRAKKIIKFVTDPFVIKKFAKKYDKEWFSFSGVKIINVEQH